MDNNRKFLLLPLIAALALLAAFVLTAPVYAQDEVPPEAVPEEVPVEEVAEEPAPLGETLAETGVVLVDESGEPLALATEESAEALAGGDPWYKVGTKTYNFTFADCDPDPLITTACTEPIEAALTYIRTTTGLPSDGLIHVEAGTYPTDNLNIVVGTNPVYAGFKGFIGTVVDGLPAVIMTFGRIHVEGVTSGFTVTGFDISTSTAYAAISIADSSGAVKIEDVDLNNSSALGHGLEVINHNGSVTINRAKVDGNAGGGALIDNRLGTAGVTITNSSFNNNVSDAVEFVGGLSIATRGSVSMTGVTAYGNTGGQPGLFIHQSGALTIKNSVFSNNAGYGFNNTYALATTIPTASITLSNVVMNGNTYGNQFFTKGAVSFTGVSANANYARTFIETCNQVGGVCEWAGSGVVTIKNSSFDANDATDWGLFVSARGAITLTGVSASGNAGVANNPGGVTLDNHYSQIAAPVKVTTGWFNDNDYDGLDVISKGTVSLSKIFASDNDAYGVWVNNTHGTTPSVSVSGASTVYNQFNDNGIDGIYVMSKGAISVKYSNFLGNLDDGATLYNDYAGATAGITVANSNFIENGDDNLRAYSYGAIKLSYIEANQSPTGNGAELYNASSPSSPGVTISNANFWDNFTTGLWVESKGNIILTNTAAWDNDGAGGVDGAYLNNSTGTGYIKVSNPKSTDIDMFAGFNNNHDRGLNMFTNGTVTLTNVNMIANQEQGMYAGLGTYPAGVTMTNCRVDDNQSSGIIIQTTGPVVISGGHANNNLGYGLRVNNSYTDDALPKPVTIKNFTANGNSGYGVWVTSKGAIALSNVTANDTVGANNAAIWLENNVAGALIPSVTLTKVYASGNIYHGVYVLSNGVVKYSTGESSHNGRIGVYVNTLGAITLSNVIGVWNSYHGAELLNSGSTTHAAISVSGSTSAPGFSNNGGYGIRMQSKGTVTLKNLNLDNNSGWGLYASNNVSSEGVGNFTVSSVNARGNSLDGLCILSNGVVTLSSVTSMLNNGDGAFIASNNHNVVISNSVMIANRGNGIDISAGTGIVTITNTLYFGNDTDNTPEPNLYIH